MEIVATTTADQLPLPPLALPPPPKRARKQGFSVGTEAQSLQLGQLLLLGCEQEFVNGQCLRNAYVYDESAYNHDARMRLLDFSTGGKGKPAV